MIESNSFTCQSDPFDIAEYLIQLQNADYFQDHMGHSGTQTTDTSAQTAWEDTDHKVS
jgi:hypothetical protein